MTKVNINIVIIVCSVLLSSCIGSATYDKKLSEGYELSANDDLQGMSIYAYDGQYQIGIINATVFAVGYNEEYIIAKQHPRKFPNPLDKSVTNYFIIPLKNKIHKSPVENKIGPLTELEFKVKRKKLAISKELDFTIIFKSLE